MYNSDNSIFGLTSKFESDTMYRKFIRTQKAENRSKPETLNPDVTESRKNDIPTIHYPEIRIPKKNIIPKAHYPEIMIYLDNSCDTVARFNVTLEFIFMKI